MQRVIDRAHQVDQLVVDDADNLLIGAQTLQNLLADGLLADAVHELLHDREADVGLEQRLLHQAQTIAHVGLGETGFAAQRP